MSSEGDSSHGNDPQAGTSSEGITSRQFHTTTSSANQQIMSKLRSPVADKFLRIELDLCMQINCLSFSAPVQYVYSPIEYAFELHSQYVRKFCNSTKKVLFLGMNPGPWGMCQTGVRMSCFQSVHLP